MAFPKIAVKATNLELSPGLTTLIDQKLIPLEKYLPQTATDVSCRVEVEKFNEHHSGKYYRVEVNLFASGRVYRAEAQEEQVEKAIDEVRGELKQELMRVLGKKQSLVRRGKQMIKDMLRFG